MKQLIITCGLMCTISTQVYATQRIPFKEVKYFCRDNVRYISLVAVDALKPGFKITYSWSHNLGSSQSVTISENQFKSGTVICSLNCACGGTAVSAFNLNFEELVPAFDFETTNPECHGLNGIVNIIAKSGVTSVLWGNGSNEMTRNLPAGTHSVEIYDRAGCYINSTVILTEPDSFPLTKSYSKEINDISCFGLANGSTELKFSDPSLNTIYQYKWNTGVTGVKNTGLKAGTYILNVKNREGACVTIPFSVKQPEQLNISYTLSNFNGQEISCAGRQDGTFTYWVIGGTQPYKSHLYKLTSAKSGTNLHDESMIRSESITLDNLSAGIYSVFVTDSLGCTTDKNVKLSEPEPLKIFHVPAYDNNIDITCNGNKETIRPYITGGNGKYSYLWNSFNKKSKVFDSISNIINPLLHAGDYTLKVTDENGCTKNQAITVLQADALDYTSRVLDLGLLKIAKFFFTGGYGNKYFLPNGKKIKSKVIISFKRRIEKKIILRNGNCERELIIVIDTQKASKPKPILEPIPLCEATK